MPQEYQKEILKLYLSRKGKNDLENNLLHPTAAKLREECANVFHYRPSDNIKNIFQSFGPIGFQINTADDILNIDPDKFRPLLNFMRGEITSPSPHNVKLLEWLINNNEIVEPKPIDENPQWIKKILSYIKKNALVTGGLLIGTSLGAGGYWIAKEKQCMYWNGDYYQAIGCEIKVDSAVVIALDQQKLKRLKRITRLDTVGEKDLGKTWYVKVKIDSVEFYTASGDYPLNPKKRLLPMSPYILNKYILKAPQKIEAVKN